MIITENIYTCITCRQQYGDGQVALVCHKKGWIRRPQELQDYGLNVPALLILATAISAGLHRN